MAAPSSIYLNQGRYLERIKRKKNIEPFDGMLQDPTDIIKNKVSSFTDNMQSDIDINELKQSDDKGYEMSKKALTKLEELLQQYESRRDAYKSAEKIYKDKINKYLKAENIGNEYHGKNVTIDGQTAYVTEKGKYKIYNDNSSATSYNCPTNDPSKNILTSSSSDVIEGTSMNTSGQMCGNEGSNIYVTKHTAPDNIEYTGCYVADHNDDNLESDLGVNVNYTDCAQRALDRNRQYFSLQKGTGEDQCYTWDEAPSQEQNSIIQTTIISTNSSDSSSNPVLILTYDGSINIYNTTDSGLIDKAKNAYDSTNITAEYIALMESIDTNNPLYTVTINDSSNLLQNCDSTYGGGINSVVAGWNSQCSAGDDGGKYAGGHDNWSNFSNDELSTGETGYIKDMYGKSIDVNVLSGVKYDQRKFSVNNLRHYRSELSGKHGIPGRAGHYGKCDVDSPYNFNATYKCGKDNVKSISGRGLKNMPYIYNCIGETSVCTTPYLILNDDGSVVLHLNSEDNDETTTIHEAADSNITYVSNNNWLGDDSTNILHVGQILSSNEYLTSSNGYFQLLLNENGQLWFNSCHEACIDTSGDGIYKPDYSVTTNNAAAYYTYDNHDKQQNMFKIGYVTDDAILREYPSSMIEDARGSGNSNARFSVLTNTSHIYGSVIGKATNTPPTNIYWGHPNNPTLLTEGNSLWKVILPTLEDAKKAITDVDGFANNCVGFSVNNRVGRNNKLYTNSVHLDYTKSPSYYTFYTKMYPDSGTIKTYTNKSWGDLYRLMPTINNNNTCNNTDIQEISTYDWELYKNGDSMGDKMTPNTLCNLANNIKTEKLSLEDAKRDYIQIIQEMSKEILKNEKTNSKLSNKLKHLVNEANEDIVAFENINIDLGNLNDQLHNIYALASDSDYKLISNTNKYILWSILAIISITICIKIARK